MNQDDVNRYVEIFKGAFPGAVEKIKGYYDVDFDGEVVNEIVRNLEILFNSNPKRVKRQVEHLMASFPTNDELILTYAAKYSALLFADTIVQITMSESTGIRPVVTRGHGLMAIRVADSAIWHEDNLPRADLGMPRARN